MTTATGNHGQVSPAARAVTGMRPLVIAMVVVDLLVGLVVLLAAVFAGADAAVAALVGGLLAAAVLFTGTVTVNLVASRMPSASLLVAVVTYLMHVVLLAVVLWSLVQSPLGDDDTSRTWMAVAVIAATVVWLATQLVAATRARIPLYDLPEPSDRTMDAARPPVEGGGER